MDRFLVPKLLCLLALTARLSSALHLSTLTDHGRAILLVHDCGAGVEENCETQGGFEEDDDERVDLYLRTHHVDEIWLWSGGGNLDTGIKMADVFRRYKVTVRVPGTATCASSCTVAFLGGWFRYVDPDAKYDVHSASGYLNTKRVLSTLNRLKEDPLTELQRQAHDERQGQRELAMELFIVFQEAITPGHPNLASRAVTPEWLRQPTPVPYLASDQAQEDAELIRREGISAAQSVLMKIERDSMNLAISDLESILPSLGPRAKYALAMLRAMYSSRITSVDQLNQETLLEMGYTTKIVNLGVK